MEDLKKLIADERLRTEVIAFFNEELGRKSDDAARIALEAKAEELDNLVREAQERNEELQERFEQLKAQVKA